MGQVCGKSETPPATQPATAAENGPEASVETNPTASDNISATLALGAGCYWGTEKFVKKNFQQKFPNSIKKAKVGFMNPDPNPKIKKPTYQEVCTGRTGHVEVLFVELNDPKKHFVELIRFFFTFHDPTTKDRQGNDTGSQYTSFIFCSDEEQTKIATAVKAEVQSFLDSKLIKTYSNRKVVTKIAPYTKFTEAEQAHQEYLAKNPNGYCNHYIRVKKWPKAPSSG